MPRSVRDKLVIGDVIVIAAVCLAALLVALFPVFARSHASYVKITVGLDDDSILLPLDEDVSRIVEAGEYTLTVNVKDGKVSVLDASCPDRVCVNSGSISRSGEVIVCAPAMVTVEILSESEEADYVVG